MKNRYEKVRTRFAREIRFEVKPVPVRTAETTTLERVKNRLLRQQLKNIAEPEENAVLQRAANDAAALAWNTGFPLLVFPELFEEKALDARIQARRQARILERTRNLFLEAA